jgi:hypothetical protein
MPLFDNILTDVPRFLQIARNLYPQLPGHLNDIYDDSHYHVQIMYIPLHEAAKETIDSCPSIVFLQGGLKKYFFVLGKTIQRSARVEFFSYLKLNLEDVGHGILTASKQSHHYAGQLLPDTMSSFPPGYKVVSFYADPESLIAGAYVLRRDGWRDSSHLYQRILVRSKIAKMRRYLIDQKRVFVNNIIVTLPSNTALNDPKGKGTNIPEKDLNKAQAIIVSIPVGYSVIGIIDGQHRVFCYHEGDDALEPKIALHRKRQHLLVTGIIYPPDIKEKARLEFEARLFLEINDTQRGAILRSLDIRASFLLQWCKGWFVRSVRPKEWCSTPIWASGRQVLPLLPRGDVLSGRRLTKRILPWHSRGLRQPQRAMPHFAR